MIEWRIPHVSPAVRMRLSRYREIELFRGQLGFNLVTKVHLKIHLLGGRRCKLVTYVDMVTPDVVLH